MRHLLQGVMTLAMIEIGRGSLLPLAAVAIRRRARDPLESCDYPSR